MTESSDAFPAATPTTAWRCTSPSEGRRCGARSSSYGRLFSAATSTSAASGVGSLPVATALMYAYLIISVVLLLNMLIAMMGATYQRVAEAAAENRKLQFAQYVVCWRGLGAAAVHAAVGAVQYPLPGPRPVPRAPAPGRRVASARTGRRGARWWEGPTRGPSARVGLTEWARAVAPEDDFGAASDGEWRGWWWGTAKRRRRLSKFVDDYHAAHEHEIVRDRLGSTLEQLSEMLLGVERRLKDQVFGSSVRAVLDMRHPWMPRATRDSMPHNAPASPPLQVSSWTRRSRRRWARRHVTCGSCVRR